MPSAYSPHPEHGAPRGTPATLNLAVAARPDTQVPTLRRPWRWAISLAQILWVSAAPSRGCIIAHDHVDGKPIDAYHEICAPSSCSYRSGRRATEAMGRASGDDWIQCLPNECLPARGAEIAGVMAAHCRRLGFSARSATNAHSEVIHNPAIVMAGLGEVSASGDTLLNPFIWPALEIRGIHDGPADGCLTSRLTLDCRTSAPRPMSQRAPASAPCNAIPASVPKVMFNGLRDLESRCGKMHTLPCDSIEGLGFCGPLYENVPVESRGYGPIHVS